VGAAFGSLTQGTNSVVSVDLKKLIQWKTDALSETPLKVIDRRVIHAATIFPEDEGGQIVISTGKNQLEIFHKKESVFAALREVLG
jgi:hypothetical protein